MREPREAIGGYFELEISQGAPLPFADAYRFQSARAAFASLLDAGKPKRVWVPRYVCDAVLLPLRCLGVDYRYYSIDVDFSVEQDVLLREGDWLLYVNYFGLCQAQEQQVIERFGSSKVVLDRSQAFFAEPVDCLAAIYSPRKFFGVPDGGFLLTDLEIEPPVVVDSASVTRTRHLLMRLAEGPEAGYADYRFAEQQLNNCETLRMSDLTERLLASIDYDSVKVRRTENFRFLHRQLGSTNALALHQHLQSGPLCYPLLLESADARDRLIDNRVYVARYWEEVLRTPGLSAFEEAMARNCLPLPCDQRYGLSHMQRIVELLQ